MAETITFELIRKIQREEQRVHNLTKLPENFFETVNSYLENKRRLEREDRKTALEIKNIERLVEDIFNRRERKIINQAIIFSRAGIKPENLTDEEKVFFERIVDFTKKRRDSFFKIAGKEKAAPMIVFKEDVPEFIGSDLKNYGPFKKGEIAKLPEENMKIFLEKGLAEEFKVQK